MTTIVGDVIVDEYLHCTVAGKNPEVSGGFKLLVEDRQLMLGGAAAVANLMLAYGRRPLLASVVSNDAFGRWITAELATRGVETEIFWDATRKTTRKTRIIVDGVFRPDRLDDETTEELKPEYVGLVSSINLSDILLLIDYNKGVLTDEVCRALIDRAHTAGIPVIVDPAFGKSWDVYRGASLIKANKYEATIATDQDDNDPQYTARLLATKYGCQVIVTDGDRGMAWAEPCCPTLPSNFGYVVAKKVGSVVDQTGCGDNVLAAVAHKFGEPLSVVCEFAAGEAAKCVTKIGVC